MAMLFGAREGDPRRFEAPGIRELVLAGLDDGSAAALLARHAHDAAPGVQERLLTEAAGNPLALVELPAALSQAQLAGEDPLPEALPLTLRLQAAFAQKAARLPETTQMALLIGHLATMALVEAIWGRANEARDHAGQLPALGRNRDAPYLIGIAKWRLGMLHLGQGQPDQAAGHLLAATAADSPESHPMIALRAVPDAVEAAVHAGRQPEITARFARYQEWVSRSPTAEHTALYSRSRALLEPAKAGGHFHQALAAPAALPPFWRGRTELLYGQWLRRGRQRQEARRHLRAAVELFHQLRALPWEDRAAAELRATGETTRARGSSALDRLTPQEQHIAGLVADGLTNAEIAARLFLSPRTIDYHLRKVFTKLGIASRTELARLVLPQRNID